MPHPKRNNETAFAEAVNHVYLEPITTRRTKKRKRVTYERVVVVPAPASQPRAGSSGTGHSGDIAASNGFTNEDSMDHSGDQPVHHNIEKLPVKGMVSRMTKNRCIQCTE